MEQESRTFTIEDIAKFCKRKGFVIQTSEIYGGFSGFFDFLPLGVELKNNLKNIYWRNFVSKREDVVGQDGSIITHPKVWQASGHTKSFTDLLLITKETKTKIRADHFVEDELNISADGLSADEIWELIEKNNLKFNGEDFEKINHFNLMFQTEVGASRIRHSKAYLRPETAQNIFPNFKVIAQSSRLKLPFGITQIGKAYRNEISPREFLFRCREFEQIELEYFFNPHKERHLDDKILDFQVQFLSAENQKKEGEPTIPITLKEMLESSKISLNTYHIYWLFKFLKFLIDDLGLHSKNLRIREHARTELSHYSCATFDIEYKFPMGFKEIAGFANRTNYDLTQHQKFSNQKLEFFCEETQSNILPCVIESSCGVERLILAVLCEAYKKEGERGNDILKLNFSLTPYKVAVFPLLKKQSLVEISRRVFKRFTDSNLNTLYDDRGSIGRRYARQDEIGTPFCVTIDYDTIQDESVTLRDRDTTKQKRILIDNCTEVLRKLVGREISFEDI